MAGHPTTPDPFATSTEARSESGAYVAGWVVFLSALAFPRLVLLGFWIFSDLINRAFDGWVLPLLGFLLLPWTALTYAIVWSVASDGVYGWEWILVGFGLLLDLGTYGLWRVLRA